MKKLHTFDFFIDIFSVFGVFSRFFGCKIWFSKILPVLGKPLGTISAVQMDFVQIAFQPPPPQATGPFGATFFAEN